MGQLGEKQDDGSILWVDVEVRGAAFVTNPGDEGHIDFDASSEVQAAQLVRREELKAKHLEEVRKIWHTTAD